MMNRVMSEDLLTILQMRCKISVQNLGAIVRFRMFGLPRLQSS